MKSAILPVFLLLSIAPVMSGQGSAGHVAVRETVERYLDALRSGNGEAIRGLSRSGAARYSPGGTRLPGYLGRGGDKRKVSYFVRHVEMLTPDAAVAVGIWRDTEAGTKNPSGSFSFTLVKEGESWKLATVQETLNQALPSLEGLAAEPVKMDGEWEVLFDGSGAGHWLTMTGGDDLGKSWRVAEGCLISVPGTAGADLRSDRLYRSFELRWEWMAAARSNSGVKYRLYGMDTVNFGPGRFASGWEYQMADDAGDSGAKVDDRQKSGALYGVVAVSKPAAKAAGEWNESRLVVAEDHVEHWLNGVNTARYGADYAFESPLLLQHHMSEVRFRNIRVKRLGAER